MACREPSLRKYISNHSDHKPMKEVKRETEETSLIIDAHIEHVYNACRLWQ
jgi:hypothetical protein